MNQVHRFPKWLLSERFEISHSPACREANFRVVIFDKVSGRFEGLGNSIAEAAKAARQRRDAPR